MRRGIAALSVLTVLTGCTAAGTGEDRPRPTNGLRLVSFDSCADALADLRAAARESVGPWGFSGHPLLRGPDKAGVRTGGDPAGESARTGTAPPPHSTTNNHEADADEPDLVKTDGSRIVSLTDGVLRVVDPARRVPTGRLDLTRVDGNGDWSAGRLLLYGDRALVLAQLVDGPSRRGVTSPQPGPAAPQVDSAAPPPDAAAPQPDMAVPRPELRVRPALPQPGVQRTGVLLVELTGTPRVLGRYHVDGELVDARRVGGTARMVVRSQPRISFPEPAADADDPERIAANQAVIDQTPIADWLPRYEWTDVNGNQHPGQLPCDRLARPTGHTGVTLLNLISFDLAAGTLGDGNPVSVVADGDTVYGTATSLYLADSHGGRFGALRADGIAQPSEPISTIHRFDLTSPGRPRYVASGTVPGHLINQYALSEWREHLRVATTDPGGRAGAEQSSSAVYVLRTTGTELRRVGAVTGLGRGEQIYSVRYLGDTGHVVTFRQTDPLYTLDLRDPTSPRVTGELKITGYSGHLQPVGPDRLLGVGQEADLRGVRQGLLVSLFDVGDPARPTRLAHHHRAGAYSPAEHDPHALLFWPPTGLVVLPVSSPRGDGQEALVLRTGASTLTEVGRLTHPGTGQHAGIIRALIVGDDLWTLSPAGLRAHDPAGLGARAWIPAI